MKKRNEDSIIKDKIIRVSGEERYRRLFFSIGLATSLSLVLLAFEWKSHDPVELVELGELDVQFEALQEIPITQQEPPKPQKINNQVILEVPNKVIEEAFDIEMDLDITEETAIETLVFEETPEEEQSDEIFQIVEQPAEPVGGMDKFYQFITKNLVYPKAARKAKVEGKVYVQFVVDQEGKISEVTTLKGLGFGLDAEAVRVMNESPKWLPAKQRGRAVKSMVILPLVFKLS